MATESKTPFSDSYRDGWNVNDRHLIGYITVSLAKTHCAVGNIWV